jgi:hypothetical protein
MIQPCRPCVSKEAATLFTDEQKENDPQENGHEQLAYGQVTMERTEGRTYDGVRYNASLRDKRPQIR